MISLASVCQPCRCSGLWIQITLIFIEAAPVGGAQEEEEDWVHRELTKKNSVKERGQGETPEGSRVD